MLKVVIGLSATPCCRGTELARPMRRIPPGDRALRCPEPHPVKTVIYCVLLRGIQEIETLGSS